MQLLAKQKVRTVVNNRFDDESTGQPKSADLEKAAEEYSNCPSGKKKQGSLGETAATDSSELLHKPGQL